MSNQEISVEEFRTLALAKFRFLETIGFQRNLSLEDTSSTGSSVVYQGTHVGFIFSFDVRDQSVDAQVVKVINGQIKRNWEGGYSSGILTHLIKHAGYRGSLNQADIKNSKDSGASLNRMIDRWIELLSASGQMLLNDRPDSLPQ